MNKKIKTCFVLLVILITTIAITNISYAQDDNREYKAICIDGIASVYKVNTNNDNGLYQDEINILDKSISTNTAAQINISGNINDLYIFLQNFIECENFPYTAACIPELITISSTDGGYVVSIPVSEKIKVAKEKTDIIIAQAKALSAQSDEAKAIKIHDMVIDMLTPDPILYTSNIPSPNGNITPFACYYYGQYSTCVNYSRIYNYLANEAGLKTYIAQGSFPNMDHDFIYIPSLDLYSDPTYDDKYNSISCKLFDIKTNKNFLTIKLKNYYDVQSNIPIPIN